MEPKLTIRELVEILGTLDHLSEKLSINIKQWEEILENRKEGDPGASEDTIRRWIQEDAAHTSNLLKLRMLIKNTTVRLTTEE